MGQDVESGSDGLQGSPGSGFASVLYFGQVGVGQARGLREVLSAHVALSAQHLDRLREGIIVHAFILCEARTESIY